MSHMNWLTILLIIKAIADGIEQVLRGGQPKEPVKFVDARKRRRPGSPKEPPGSPGAATA
jgi:hypothetical protein